MATTVFDLRTILASSIQTAIELARQSENVTVDQVMEQVMANVNIQQIEITPVKTKTARTRETKEPKEPKEKIERVRAAPAKPRGIPEDEVRCCARSLYEKDHLEGGKPKAMRDDEANLYGDRCKFKKVGETEFCKHHAEKQPLGVWGAEYAGKFHALVQKLNAPVEDKPKAAKEDKPKTEKPAKKSKVAAEVCELTEEEPSTPAVEKPKAAKVEQPKAAPAATKPVAPEPAEDEEVAEVEECEIDGKTYLRDNEGTIYDMESEEEVGQYNFNTKKWIKRA
jgi:hypothetical protein